MQFNQWTIYQRRLQLLALKAGLTIKVYDVIRNKLFTVHVYIKSVYAELLLWSELFC